MLPSGMTTRFLALTLASFALLFGSGCAKMKLTQTGFLPDYSQLKAAPDKEVSGVPDEVLFYEANGVDWSKYQSVLIEPVVYRPAEGAPELSAKQQAGLSEKFQHHFSKAYTKQGFTVVNKPGTDTIRVRAAYTDVNKSNVLINVVMVILAVPVDMGGISGEMELLDASTGEQLVAMTAHRDGTPFLLFECFTPFGHAKHGMKKWSRQLANISSDE
jgi:hypothetical protein